jgi:hypothetical protein
VGGGGAGHIKNIYWRMAERQFYYDHKSAFVIGETLEEKFYHPASRFKILITKSIMLKNACLFSDKRLEYILFKLYVYYSRQAVWSFMYFTTDEIETRHYGIEPRKYTNSHLYTLYLDFYKNYKHTEPFSWYSWYFKILFLFSKLWMIFRIYKISIQKSIISVYKKRIKKGKKQ